MDINIQDFKKILPEEEQLTDEQLLENLKTLVEGLTDNRVIPIHRSVIIRTILALKAIKKLYCLRSLRGIPKPTITLCPDGSVDLFWKNISTGLRLLVNISENEPIDYFGENSSYTTIKGKESDVSSLGFLGYWLARDLLKMDDGLF